MADFNITEQISPDNFNDKNQSDNTGKSNVMPHQDCTLIRSDLLIAGDKIYSHASSKCSKDPGLSNGNTAPGIGVYLNFMQDQRSIQIQIQALLRPPLKAEAQALLLAAKHNSCLLSGQRFLRTTFPLLRQRLLEYCGRYHSLDDQNSS